MLDIINAACRLQQRLDAFKAARDVATAGESGHQFLAPLTSAL